MYEKFINNPCNLWRSIRLKQNWGEHDLSNPPFIFGCNNILDTKNLDKKELYREDNEYYKTNGDDIELCKFLRKNNHKLHYNSEAICYHLQNDTYKSIAERYWRYVYYGDGLKKRNLFKTLKNIIRQIKKVLFWTAEDIFRLRFSLIFVNLVMLIYLVRSDIKNYKSDEA